MKSYSNVYLAIGMAALVGAGLLPARLKPPEKASAADAPIVVPFRMLPSNHMVVEAKLNGKGPFRFIFDLGAPVTLLTNKAAEDSGAIDKKSPKSFFMATRGEAEVKQLQMGELIADKVPVIVMDHPALGALSGLFSKPLAGIIGYTFWARYQMTIDYQAKKLTFTPIADFEVQDLFKELPQRLSGPKRAQTVVIAPRAILGMEIEATANSKAASGVEVTRVLAGSAAERAGLKPHDILTTLDGRWTTSIADTFAAAEKLLPGTSVSCGVLREGTLLDLSVTPREGL
jgi:hypothetical protein